MQKMRTLRIYYIGTLVLTLAATILRTLALTLSLDPTSGYFKAGAALPIALTALLAFSTAIILLSPLGLQNRIPTAAPQKNALHHAGSVLCALCFLVAFVGTCIAKKTVALPALLWPIAFLSLLAAVVYFLAKTPLCPMGTVGEAIFGSLTLIAIACLIAVTYFDIDTPMNAPAKVHLHLALLALMLCLLYELREAVGIPIPRVRVAFTALAFFLAATVGISDLIASAARGFVYLSQDLLLTGLALYTATRAVSDLKALSYTERETL